MYNMNSEWITEPGRNGVVRLTGRDGSWYVTNPSTKGETKCILQSDFDLSQSQSPAKVEIRVAKYISANAGGPDYLFAEPANGDTKIEATGTDGEAPSPGTDTDSGPDHCSLTDLTGSGEYVTVEAVVDEIFWVNKDEQYVPDIAGAVRDEDSTRQMFVVGDGVSHPYLEEGRKFVFQDAKDHYYRNGDKVQLMITQHTDFTDKGLTAKADAQQHTTPEASNQKRTSSDSSESGTSASKSLRQIANSMLGGKEFTMTRQRESSISEAKKKAKRQQRDPAIDPKLNENK